MNRLVILFVFLLWHASCCMSQEYMRIHYKGGGCSDVAIEQVDSVTFIKDGDAPAAEVSLIGAWLWGSQEQGYYELITFSEDHTYTGYDNYFAYGFDTMTYGWWTQIGAMKPCNQMDSDTSDDITGI